MSSTHATAAVVPAGPLADPRARAREHRFWYLYDWANSAYVTVTATVLFGPYLTAVARAAACPGLDDDLTCSTPLSLVGIPIAAGSLAAYTVTAATILSVLVLPVVGAIADRLPRPRLLLAASALVGAAAASAMVFVAGDNWQLGVALLMMANISLGSSLVVYDAILCQIAADDDRDRVSSRGWALGYLGGGLLLLLTLVLLQLQPFGLSTGDVVRLCLLLAGLWWGAWTLVAVSGLRDRPATHVERATGGLLRQSFGQLRATLLDLRRYPQTVRFLVAYLIYNDGIQTVIVTASLFGAEELDLPQSTLVLAILVVQFVALFGALALGRVASALGVYKGAKYVILSSLIVWTAVVASAFVLPAQAPVAFIALAAAIGVVLGGSQALSRSLYSVLIPSGREAEYFSLYQAAERGTSWFGTLIFGLVFQVTGSYRDAVFALVAFFILGFVLLVRVNVSQGIGDVSQGIGDVRAPV